MGLNRSPLVNVIFYWISALGVRWFPRAQRVTSRTPAPTAEYLQVSAAATSWCSEPCSTPAGGGRASTARPVPVSGATRGGFCREFLVIFWSVWRCYGRFWTFSSSRLDSTGPGHPRKWSPSFGDPFWLRFFWLRFVQAPDFLLSERMGAFLDGLENTKRAITWLSLELRVIFWDPSANLVYFY